MIRLSTIIRLLLLALVCVQGAKLNAATRFRALAWGGGIDDIYFQSAGGQMEKLSARKRSFSETYVYPGEAPLQFFRRGVSPETGTDIYQPVATLNPIPAFQTIGLLFFAKPDGGYQLHAIDIGRDRLPGGAFNFVNMTRRKLAFQVGKMVFHLDPGQDRDVSPDQVNEMEDDSEDAVSGGSSIIIRAAEEQSGEWVPLLNVRWALSKSTRTFVFIYNNEDGEIAMRRFNDRV